MLAKYFDDRDDPVYREYYEIYRETVEIFDDGWIDIEIVAVDPSGNRTERTERVFVEVY